MSISNQFIKFKKIYLEVNKQEENNVENFGLDSNFHNFMNQISQLLQLDITGYKISIQSSSEENEDKKDNIEVITNQQEYEQYIQKAHIQDSQIIHIYLDSIPPQNSSKAQILDSCFDDNQKINESFEFNQPVSDIKIQINQQKGNYINENSLNQKYDASEAIIETSEMSMINPSLQLSHLQSKQKSSEFEQNPLNGQLKKTSISNLNILTTRSNEKIQSNDIINSPEINLDINNREQIENIINYEIIRQILNKFPKLQPENIDDDIKIKQHMAYFQSQNAANRRSTSPQPKGNKKANDLSQSMPLSNYKCNICRDQIENVRFHCLVCQNTDHCEKCQRENRGEHNHPFMKYKNVTSNKLNKSQRLYPNQTINNLAGATPFQETNSNTTSPFQLTGKNMASSYFNTPLQTPQQTIKNSMNGSNANLQTVGMFNFQSLQRSGISPLAQTMPSAQRQQQQMQQPNQQQGNMFFNNLQQSQNLNFPINPLQQNIFNELFANQVQSQTYNISSIPQQNQSKTFQVHQQFNNNISTINQNSSSSSSQTNSSNFSNLKVQNLSQQYQKIQVKKGSNFTVEFIVKNGDRVQFPEGTVIRGFGIYENIKKAINPLKFNEQQVVEIELKAPLQEGNNDYLFKVEFPNNQTAPTRFSFILEIF